MATLSQRLPNRVVGSIRRAEFPLPLGRESFASLVFGHAFATVSPLIVAGCSGFGLPGIAVPEICEGLNYSTLASNERWRVVRPRPNLGSCVEVSRHAAPFIGEDGTANVACKRLSSAVDADLRVCKLYIQERGVPEFANQLDGVKSRIHNRCFIHFDASYRCRFDDRVGYRCTIQLPTHQCEHLSPSVVGCQVQVRNDGRHVAIRDFGVLTSHRCARNVYCVERSPRAEKRVDCLPFARVPKCRAVERIPCAINALFFLARGNVLSNLQCGQYQHNKPKQCPCKAKQSNERVRFNEAVNSRSAVVDFSAPRSLCDRRSLIRRSFVLRYHKAPPPNSIPARVLVDRKAIRQPSMYVEEAV